MTPLSNRNKYALAAHVGVWWSHFGSWLSGLIPETVLLALFAILMLIVALRMWSKASELAIAGLPVACSTEATHVDGPACRTWLHGFC